MSYRFKLRSSKSPTYANLSRYLKEQGWKPTHFNWRANFSENNFQFPTDLAEHLEFKNLLAELVAQYCPEVMPITYCINDHNWPIILSQIAEQYYRQGTYLRDQLPQLSWILKPALLNNGQYIKIFQKLSQIEQHFLSTDRMGGEHVLQQYVQDPYLLQGPKLGHKFSIRMFVVLTNYAGAYVFPQGYFNVALNPYSEDDFSDLRSHLTNEHLSHEAFNVVQIPTQQYDFFKPFYPKIKTILSAVLNGLHQLYSKDLANEQEAKLALFGFDFLIDSNSRVWLLEANNAPCFPVSDEHPLQKNVYYHFWQALISSFVEPIARQQALECNQQQLFDRIE